MGRTKKPSSPLSREQAEYEAELIRFFYSKGLPITKLVFLFKKPARIIEQLVKGK